MKKILTFFGILWILIITASYFITYPLPYFTRHLIEISLLCIITFLSFQIGYFLLKKFNFNFNVFLEIAASIGIGLAFFSLITFFLGIFGILYKPVFYILLSILLVLSLINFRHKINLKMPKLDLWGFLSIFTILIFIISAFIGAMAPPTFYDSLVYHLSIPSQYIKNHKIFYIDYNLYANFPQNIEMLYTMALILYNDILANLLHFIYFPLTLLLMYGFFWGKSEKNIPLLSILTLVTTPAIVLLAYGTYIDLGLTFYLFLSFVLLIEWINTNNNKLLILTGLLCGFSIGIKYTAVISVFIFSLIVLYTCLKEKRNIIKPVLLFLSSIILVISPWLIKNYIFTNNPIFPFYIFSETPLYIKKYLTHVSSHGTYGFLSFVCLPWDLTMEGTKFGGGFDFVGPLFLIFLPVLLFIKNTDKIMKICMFYLITFFLLWSTTARVLRFLIPIFPIAAVVFSVCIFQFLNTENKWTKNITGFLFVIIVISNFSLLLYIQNSFSPGLYFFGNITREKYLSRFVGPNNFYPAVKFMNETFDNNSKTLF